MNAQRQIATFLEAQAAELDAAVNTRLAYARDLKDFAVWCDGQKTALLDVAQSDIESYLVALEASGLARSTRARRLSAIRQLYRFAFEEGWRKDNPAQRISGPKRAKLLPKTLSEAEVDALLIAARETGRPSDRLRNTCLMELLYATGMRVSELVSLPVAAARGNPQMLLVRGKGGKERMVPLSEPAREALVAWLSRWDETEEVARLAKGTPHSKFLFPSRSKT
ncbi:MAG: tyrosine-type recombinase/integrase, partial [Boseongicola sp.]|nr:tyrosine-type recombinase/integrase [Boseongicola sp.]